MLRRGLRIAVPEDVLRHNPRGGHGRVWHSVLAELGRLARVRVGGGRRADAWLIDGHAGSVDPAGRPAVAQVHETSWVLEEVRDSMDAGFLDMLEERTRAGMACADRVITASEATRSQIAAWAGWDPGRIDVVAHGVDVELFRPGLRPPVDEPYVLFAATVHPRKNLRSLRRAMERLHGFGHALVVVAGPAPDREDSAALEEEAFAPLPGRSVLRVERPSDADLAALMAGCSAFVLPSLWEGFGLTALEALACGAPVVVSARGALPEVVGDAGLAVEPTPDGIEAALRRILGDPPFADRLRRAARERAVGMTWRHTAHGWLASVERALASA